MKFFYCKNCLMPSTRPRVTFNKDGICNGCEWSEKKKTEIDWDARWKSLEGICDKYRCKDGSNWDVIVPCSGGKDSYHVAWNMKHKLNMHPLLVTVAPLLPTEIGRRNLQNLIDQGFDHIQINPNGKVYKGLCKRGFIEQGRPQLGFVTATSTATIKAAIKFNVPLMMFGEEGESEYGGAMTQAHQPKIDKEYLIKYYYSGHNTDKYLDEFSKDELKWWLLPSDKETEKINLFPTHWSHYESWENESHYEIAKKIGFKPVKVNSIEDGVTGFGTYTDFTSLDDPYKRTLHTYLMFLKFGFGRGSHEATGEIKAGSMSREDAIKIAKKYDSYDCSDFRDKILKLFDMTEVEFQANIDKWANKAILEKINGRWQLKKDIHFNLDINNGIEIDYDGKY